MLCRLPLCAVILILACPPAVMAQSPAKPRTSPSLVSPSKPKPSSFGERLKSWFTRKEQPAPRPAVPHQPKPKTAQNRQMPPIQVTTRSGSLRQPGPETHQPLQTPSTPTFGPQEIPLAGQSPRMLTPVPREARQLPGTTAGSAPNQPIRDPGVRAAAFETEQPAEKKSMRNWFRGLWPRKNKTQEQPAATGRPRIPRTMPAERQPANNQGVSIDPRKVYRTPQPEPEQDSGAVQRSFSETGIPGGSPATFRRRAGAY